MKVNKQLVDKLSDLCRLEFDETEKYEIANDLTQILNFMEKLNGLETENVEPLVYMMPEVNQWREDIQSLEVTKQEALKNAPDKDSDYIKVPKVIKNEK